MTVYEVGRVSRRPQRRRQGIGAELPPVPRVDGAGCAPCGPLCDLAVVVATAIKPGVRRGVFPMVPGPAAEHHIVDVENGGHERGTAR